MSEGRPVYSSVVSMVACSVISRTRIAAVSTDLKTNVLLLTVEDYSPGTALKSSESFP